MRPSVRRAREALTGLLVIIVGVMAALAGDEAWSARSDRARERAVLIDLLSEFEQNRSVLIADIAANDRTKAAAAIWVEAMLGHSDISRDSLYWAFQRLANDSRFDPVTGALRSLIDSGELRLIRDPELRRALAGWTDRVAETQRTAISWDGQRVAMGAVAVMIDPGGDLSPGEEIAIRMTARSSAGQLNQLNALIPDMDEIIQMIEAELAR